MGTKFVKDLFERVVSTYVQVFIGLLLASWSDTLNVGTFKAAAVAAIPAGLSVIKGLIAKQFGDAESAGFVDPVADYGIDDPE